MNSSSIIGYLYLAAVVLAFAAVFWVVRRLTSSWLQDDWEARKIVLYCLGLGGPIVLIGLADYLGGIVIIGFFVIIASFFAIITAPDRRA